MKLLLFVLLFLQGTAQAADWRDYLPSQHSLQEGLFRARHWLLEQTPRETRLFLYSHVPFLFPVDSICQLRDGTEKKALLPGDSFQTQIGAAELECRGNFLVSLRPGSTGSIQSQLGILQLEMQKGSAEFVSRNSPFSIKFPDYTLSIQSVQAATNFSLRPSGEGSLLLCNQGLAEGSLLTNRSNAPQSLIGTVNCRLGIAEKNLPGKRYLFARELVHPANLGLARERLPGQNLGTIMNTLHVDLLNYARALHIERVENPQSKAPMLRLDRNEARPANCVLYTQAKRLDPLVQAQQFSVGAEKNFFLKLSPEQSKSTLSAVCSEVTGLLISEISPFAE